MTRRGAALARQGPCAKESNKKRGKDEKKRKEQRRERRKEKIESACLTAAWLAAQPLLLISLFPLLSLTFFSLFRSLSLSLFLSPFFSCSLTGSSRLVTRDGADNGCWYQRAFGQGCHTAPLGVAWKHYALLPKLSNSAMLRLLYSLLLSFLQR